MAGAKNWASADAGPGRKLDDVCLIEWGDAENFRRAKADWLRSIRRVADIRLANMVWLLGVLGDYMKHKNDVAWPSIDRLAAELAWSRSTVKRALALAIEWGWLIRDRRYNGSNRYAMSYSRSVRAEIDDAHALRMQPFVEGRGPLGSNLSPPSVQVWSHSGLSPEPLYHRTIPSKDTEDEYQKERLGETEQDVALAQPDRSQSDWQAISDAREDLISLFGGGDSDLGTRMFAALGRRATHLAELVAAEGAGALADRILTAKADACRLIEKSTTAAQVTP